MLKYLNLGCGPRYHADPVWTNIDFKSNSASVIEHNLNRGIPFPDGVFDLVYHSNVLEHFAPSDGERLMRECFRVLKSGGICRVVVPDLENICREYLQVLEAAKQGEPGAGGRHQWMMIELLDQFVRHRTGGAMAEYLRQTAVPERDFIIGRVGAIAKDRSAELPGGKPSSPARGFPGRATAGRFAKRARQAFRRARLSLVLGDSERQALAVGEFRLAGEPHQWMYDPYSLRSLLSDVGFDAIEVCSPRQSGVSGWSQHGLDLQEDGSEHAPCSLYMEGRRKV